MADDEICQDEINQLLRDQGDMIKRVREKIYERIRLQGGRIDEGLQEKLENCTTDIRRMWDYDELYDYLELLPDGSPGANIVARRKMPLFFPGYGPYQRPGFKEYVLARVRKGFAVAPNKVSETLGDNPGADQVESYSESAAEAVIKGVGIKKTATIMNAGRIQFTVSQVWTAKAFYAFATVDDAVAAGFPHQSNASVALYSCFDGDISHDYDSIMVRFVPFSKKMKNRDGAAVSNQNTWSISKLVSVRKNHPLLRTASPVSAEELVRYDPLVMSGPSLLWVLTEGRMKPSRVRDLLNTYHGVGMTQTSGISNRRKAAVRAMDSQKGRQNLAGEAFQALEQRWVAPSSAEIKRGDSNIHTVQAFYDCYFKSGNKSGPYRLTVLGKEARTVQTGGLPGPEMMSESEEEESEEISDMEVDMEE